MYQTRTDLDEKRAEVLAMFDDVTERYDLLGSLLSLGRGRGWHRETIAAITTRPGERVLDLTAGIGTSSLPFLEADAYVFPIDLSMGMLEVGEQQQPRLSFMRGDALALPFADSVFDAVTISYGPCSVEDAAAALRETLRVAHPDGRLVIAESSAPVNRALQFAYAQGALRVLSVAVRVSSNPIAYGYLAESILTWPTQKELVDLTVDRGWRDVEWKNLTGGAVALHRAWK